MSKRKRYEDLPLLPYLIGEAVCSEVYTGSEWSVQIRDSSAVVKTEALRQAMTPQQREEFADLCDRRCKAAYEVKADYFMKCLRARDNRGRDQLYVWVRHWLSAYLNNPVSFRRHVA